MWKFREILAIFILGLLTIHCDGRAVNISNTWTLPHDGFTVFYRFFRDQISWFEADAVCQFHHANLVTVDSSTEFDAARDFLRVLDVTEPVWIGLMRPQNSDRFTWSNSKPLTITSENWAESLPLIDAPLCAVIDPIRDYRWHALRCGGPETASFLCEMNVPSWAEECVLRDIPSLTIQYMADSGTVEITKDCGIDEGTIHQVCRGKQDQERIIKKLICKNEQQVVKNLFTKNPLSSSSSPNINNMRSKILSKINNIPSDNNEDNNINIQTKGYQLIQQQQQQQQQQTENPVQKLIEQFNVEELMQADQPLSSDTTIQSKSITDKMIIDQIPKPVKKQNIKKTKSKFDKKNKSNKKIQSLPQLKGKNIALEDMMMGDQPINDDILSSQSLDNDDLNEIQAPLPHTKKSLSIDLKNHENVVKEKELIKLTTTTTTTSTENPLKLLTTTTNILDTTILINHNKNDDNIELSTTKESIIENEPTTIMTSPYANLITEKLSNEFDITTTIPNLIAGSSLPTGTPIDIVTTEKPLATIGHPMHPQQPRSNIITEETGHQQHIKETNDNHFIPPMLMVKSHYTPPKTNHNINNQQQIDMKLNKEHFEKSELSMNIDKSFDETTLSSNEPIAPIENIVELTKEQNNPIDNIVTTKTLLNSNNNLTITEVTTKQTKLDDKILSDNINFDKLPTLTTTLQPAIISDTTTSNIDLTTNAGTLITDGHQIVEIKIGNSDNPTTFSITTRAIPQQQQQLIETTKSITSDNDSNASDIIETTSKISIQHENNNEQITNNNNEIYKSTTLINKKIELNNDDLITPTTTTTTNLNQLETERIGIISGNNKIKSIVTTSAPSSSIIENNFSSYNDDKSFSETTEQQMENKKFENIRTETETATTTTTTKIIPSTTTLEYHPTKVKQSEYSNEENIDIYKPNRRRSLTKPENTSYLKKILG